MAYYSTQPNTLGQTSIGGISAVAPTAQTDFQGYVDASYGAAKQRLDPVLEQQRRDYEQSLINQGIPIGGEAANNSLQQIDQNQNDAYSQAAFDAMGFGLGAQAQDFSQAATQSQLANSLLQSQWNTELGWGNNALGYAGLTEQGRQFDAGLGEDARQFDNASLDQRYYFDTGLGEQARQFDSGQDYDYWNQGSQYDYLNNRAQASDYQWAAGQDRQDYYDSRSASQYDDAMLMALLGMNPVQNPYTQDPTSGYGAQLGSWNQQYGSNANFLASLFGG